MSLQATIQDLEKADVFNNVDLEKLVFQLEEIRKINLNSGEILLSPETTNLEIFVLLEGELIITL